MSKKEGDASKTAREGRNERSSPMSKRPYKTVDVNAIKLESVLTSVSGQHVIVGIDVAKTDMVAAVMIGEASTVVTVKWLHPAQTHQFREFLQSLKRESAACHVVMEPTGTYGDALRDTLLAHDFDVYRVSPIRVHQSLEIFDGVPSSHDGKCAAVIAKLHRDGNSEQWPMLSIEERDLKADNKAYSLHYDHYLQTINQLEAELARYWPEVLPLADLDRQWLWALLAVMGSPKAIQDNHDAAYELLKNKKLSEARIDEILAAASNSLGVPMSLREMAWIQDLATHLQNLFKMIKEKGKRLEQAVDDNPDATRMATVIGKKTAAILIACAGSPRKYASAAAYEKSLGLNLREKSSGMHRGKPRITKRGSGKCRQLLYMTSLRVLKDRPEIRAWIENKAEGPGRMRKALVGIMRKLAKALWHMLDKNIDFSMAKFINVARLEARLNVKFTTCAA